MAKKSIIATLPPPSSAPAAASPAKTPIVQGEVTRCPACGSTERSGYVGTNEQEFNGLDPKGQPYTHIVRKWTTCLGCGQRRIDRIFENRSRQITST